MHQKAKDLKNYLMRLGNAARHREDETCNATVTVLQVEMFESSHASRKKTETCVIRVDT